MFRAVICRPVQSADARASLAYALPGQRASSFPPSTLSVADTQRPALGRRGDRAHTDTTVPRFTQGLRWSQAYHRLAQGF